MRACKRRKTETVANIGGKITKLFFRALDKTEVSLRKESARRSLFHSQDPGKISNPPKERKFVPKARSRFRGGRVHQMEEEVEDVTSDQEREIEKAFLERDDSEEEEEHAEEDTTEDVSGEEGEQDGNEIRLFGSFFLSRTFFGQDW